MDQSSSGNCPPARGETSTPPLLRVPADVLLLFVDQLRETPESIRALALTCRVLYKLVPWAPVRERDGRNNLEVLFLPGIGSKFYCCSSCHRLYEIESSWGPLRNKYTGHGSEYICGPPTCNVPGHDEKHGIFGLCKPGSFRRWDWDYELTYNLARLVMTRHRYGEPFGLPLDVLNATSFIYRSRWVQSWSAKIIDNELFLSATHTTDSHDVGPRGLRSRIDRRYDGYEICPHVSSDLVDGGIAALRKPTNSMEQFSECRDVVGWCRWCLTDYSTTIERMAASRGVVQNPWDRFRRNLSAEWTITIVTYHQFGRCRDPWASWKWNAIVGRTCSEGWGSSRMAMGYQLRPGSVRNKWLASEASGD